jgi:hypothetical protein
MKARNMESVSFNREGAIEASGVPGATLDAAIRLRELKATKAGRRLIIVREDLEAWLRLCRERGSFPVPKPDQEANKRLAEHNRKRKEEAARRKTDKRDAA